MTALDTFVQDDLVAALPRLRRYARVLTGDLGGADELVMGTIAQAWEKQGSWQRGTNLATWLFAIMRDLQRDRSTALRRQPAPAPTPGKPEERQAGRELQPAGETGHARRDDIVAHLLHLPLEQREVLLLVAVERLSYGEIAALLGVPVGTVMARLNLGRKGMRLRPTAA